jgi:hypothetical protein
MNRICSDVRIPYFFRRYSVKAEASGVKRGQNNLRSTVIIESVQAPNNDVIF